ncbi:hypothetical protein AB0M44_36595 [Streptosporangium subroseum]|uniref:hypothetical protein n=1 Tax=Streptosporangium subroseum TaxID=106412 RepID=UPI00341A6AD4
MTGRTGNPHLARWIAWKVVGHIVDMHGAMLGPLGRSLSRAPSVEEYPLRRPSAVVG